MFIQNEGIRYKCALSFECMSHFVFELFFSIKIPLTFTSIVTHIHSVKKKSQNQAGNFAYTRVRCLTGVLMSVYPFLMVRT